MRINKRRRVKKSYTADEVAELICEAMCVHNVPPNVSSEILSVDYSELCPSQWRHFIFQYRCNTQVRAEEERDFSDPACIEQSAECEEKTKDGE